MSEMKHTPGPWVYHSAHHTEPGHPDLLRFRIQSGKRPIIDGYVLLQEDAALIAAAPEMHEALKEMQAYAIKMVREGGAHHHPIWAKVAGVLAKVEGRE